MRRVKRLQVSASAQLASPSIHLRYIRNGACFCIGGLTLRHIVRYAPLIFTPLILAATSHSIIIATGLIRLLVTFRSPLLIWAITLLLQVVHRNTAIYHFILLQ